jgi:hypothetical protein
MATRRAVVSVAIALFASIGSMGDLRAQHDLGGAYAISGNTVQVAWPNIGYGFDGCELSPSGRIIVYALDKPWSPTSDAQGYVVAMQDLGEASCYTLYPYGGDKIDLPLSRPPLGTYSMLLVLATSPSMGCMPDDGFCIYAFSNVGTYTFAAPAAPPTPNLIVADFTVAPEAPIVGNMFTLNATIKNIGDGNSPPTTLRYYSWNGNAWEELTACADSIGAFASGATSTQSCAILASSAGTPTFIAMIDAVPNESNTADNRSNQAMATITATPAPPVVPGVAVEYYHAGFGHYFLTASTDEIQKLDSGSFAGWTRTGSAFKVYPLDTAGADNVCRFFSTSFAPKSSHFYTPFVSECADVKANPDWQFEAEVFAFRIPSIFGACPAGTNPVYRLYNNGQSGAPNHRYTTSASIRSQMLGAGFIAEGYGPLGVIGCVPQ